MMFGSPLSRYNVALLGCRAYGTSNMLKTFFVGQCNSQTNVGKVGCRANGKTTTDMYPILISAYEETFSF